MKAAISLSIDTEIWHLAKNKISNISEFVENMLRLECQIEGKNEKNELEKIKLINIKLVKECENINKENKELKKKLNIKEYEDTIIDPMKMDEELD